MPTLRKRDFDTYYMRGRSHGTFCTWQVTAEGAEILRAYDIHVGDQVPFDVFQELRDDGFVHTGGGLLGSDDDWYDDEDWEDDD